MGGASGSSHPTSIDNAGAAAYEKSEDPLYVLQHNVPIDTRYYLDNQLSKPLMRIFEPILGDKANSLRTVYSIPVLYTADMAVAGDHTRTIQIATPTIGGLMKFAVKTVTCLGCKTPLRGTKSEPLCGHGIWRLLTVRRSCVRELSPQIAGAVPETGP